MAKIPEIKAGDLVKVYAKIKEGDKERVTPFQGIVIQIRGSEKSKTFTVRKISAGVGIERIFPIYSPMIAKIEVKKKGKVRRAKLNYLKQRRGRKMKIKEAQKTSKEKTPEPADVSTTSEQPKDDAKKGTEQIISDTPAKPEKPTPAKKNKKPKKAKEPKDEGAPGQEPVAKA